MNLYRVTFAHYQYYGVAATLPGAVNAATRAHKHEVKAKRDKEKPLTGCTLLGPLEFDSLGLHAGLDYQK